MVYPSATLDLKIMPWSSLRSWSSLHCHFCGAPRAVLKQTCHWQKADGPTANDSKPFSGSRATTFRIKENIAGRALISQCNVDFIGI
jgi:hypothetical protein